MAGMSEVRVHRAHCLPHLARLHMHGRYRPGEALPPGLADEVSEGTSAILAEAGAGARVTVAAVPGTRRAAVAGLLADRLSRLAVAAGEAVSAAEEADPGALRRCLRRFEMLTSAAWTVQLAMTGKAAAGAGVAGVPRQGQARGPAEARGRSRYPRSGHEGAAEPAAGPVTLVPGTGGI
jgi:hypothetical protein